MDQKTCLWLLLICILLFFIWCILKVHKTPKRGAESWKQIRSSLSFTILFAHICCSYFLNKNLEYLKKKLFIFNTIVATSKGFLNLTLLINFTTDISEASLKKMADEADMTWNFLSTWTKSHDWNRSYLVKWLHLVSEVDTTDALKYFSHHQIYYNTLIR